VTLRSTALDPVRQMVQVAGRYRSPRRWRVQARVNRRMTVPPLPRARRVPGSIWAVGIVRDEVDVVLATLDQLFAQGIDRILVADNGSVDGTRELLLERAAEDPRLFVARDSEPAHHQSEKVTFLAHHAWRAGADWIVPFDADEWFFAAGESVAACLRGQPVDVGIVSARMYQMVRVSGPDPIGVDTGFVLDASPVLPGKVAFRAHPLAEVHSGNHWATRVGRAVTELHLAHALYRSRDQVARKVRQGAAAERLAAGELSVSRGVHWARGARLGDAELDAVWEAISTGRPEPRLAVEAHGPMVTVRPLSWTTWDPHHEVPVRPPVWPGAELR